MTLTFGSPKEHYEAEAFILWCFDWRFDALLDEFKKRFNHPDYIKWAGGAKALASEGADRDAVMNQIKLSAKLHHTKKIVLMAHADCGAYGKYGDPSEEFAHYSGELAKAVRAIKADPDLAGMEVQCFFADFEGLRQVS